MIRYNFTTNSWAVSGQLPNAPNIVREAGKGYHSDWGIVMVGGKVGK